MKRKCLLALATMFVVFFLCASPASAHLNSTGMGPMYDGLLHFLLSPEDIVPVVALAMFAGLRGAEYGRRALFLFAGELVCGVHVGGGGHACVVVAVASDFILGIWRIGGGKCAVVVVACDDGASKRVGIGAQVDERRRNAVVCIAGRGVRGISGRNLCGCGGPSGGELDCGERVVAAGVGGKARVDCVKG